MFEDDTRYANEKLETENIFMIRANIATRYGKWKIIVIYSFGFTVFATNLAVSCGPGHWLYLLF